MHFQVTALLSCIDFRSTEKMLRFEAAYLSVSVMNGSVVLVSVRNPNKAFVQKRETFLLLFSLICH